MEEYVKYYDENLKKVGFDLNTLTKEQDELEKRLKDLGLTPLQVFKAVNLIG